MEIREMLTPDNLKKIFIENGCEKVYIKTLAANDISKSQVYLSGSYDVLNIFPIAEITTDSSGESQRFKANLNFGWITEEGSISTAPNTKFILYPKYPEVRFSGFLSGSVNAPSKLMNERLPGRLLLLSIDRHGKTLGFVTTPGSEIV